MMTMTREAPLKKKKKKKRRVGFHPPRPTQQQQQSDEQEDQDEEDEVIHDVWVDIVEFDTLEAVLSLRDPTYMLEDNDDDDELPWYEQEYEELPWWEYPDLDEDDEVTALCKAVVRRSSSNNNNWQDEWELRQATERVEALVTTFALKLINRTQFTMLLKLQQQGEEFFEDVELSVVESQKEEQEDNDDDDDDASESIQEFAEEEEEDNKNNKKKKQDDKNAINDHNSGNDEMEEDKVAKAVEEAILEVLGESASSLLGIPIGSQHQQDQDKLLGTDRKDNEDEDDQEEEERLDRIQKISLQQEQQQEMQKLLHPTGATTQYHEASKQQHRWSLPSDQIFDKFNNNNHNRPRRSSYNNNSNNNNNHNHNRNDDDNASIHSASLFSTGGWSRLNIHNAEMRRYQKNKRRNKTKSKKQQNRWWTDDHTVVAYPQYNGDQDDDDDGDGKSVASFQSSPAMMEYARTKLSLFHNASGAGARQQRRRASLESKDDSSLDPNHKKNNSSKKSPPLTQPGGKKQTNKRKKKKTAGQLALFMAKEQLKQHDDIGGGGNNNNIFDIVEETAHTQPQEAKSKPRRRQRQRQREQLVLEPYEPESIVDDEEEIIVEEEEEQEAAPEKNQGASLLGGDDDNNNKDGFQRQDKQKQDNGDASEFGKDVPQSARWASDSRQQDKEHKEAVVPHDKQVVDDSRGEPVADEPSCPEAKVGVKGALATKSRLEKDQTTKGIAAVAATTTKPVSPKKSPKKGKKKVKRASKDGLGYSSMHLPDSGPRSHPKSSSKQDDTSTNKHVNSPKQNKSRVQPLLARRASFSEIQFNEKAGFVDQLARDDNNYKSSTTSSSSELKEDPKFRLVMLRHAAVCTQAQSGGICPSDPTCSQMKELLKHMTLCKHQSTTTPCPFPGCSESKSFLVTMHRNSQIIAEQKKRAKDLPPVVSAGKENSIEDEDDLSDIGSVGSGAHSEGNDDDSSDDGGINIGRSGERRNSKVLIDLLGQSEHGSKRNRLQKSMQRRTSWTGSVELVAHSEQIEAREKERLEKAKVEVSERQKRVKMEQLERQKSEAELRRRHEEVKARVEKAKRGRTEAEWLKRIAAEQKERADRIEEEKLEAERFEAERLELERQAAREKARKHEQEIQRIKKEAELKAQQMEAEAAKKEAEKKEKLRREELERQQSEADLRKRHEEIKARMQLKNGEDPKEQIAAIKLKKQKRRKSLPASAGPNKPEFPSNHDRCATKDPSDKIDKQASEAVKEEQKDDDKKFQSPKRAKAVRRKSLPANKGRALPGNPDRSPRRDAGETAKATEEFRRICRQMSKEKTNEKNGKLVESETRLRDAETAMVTARGARIEQATAKVLSEVEELRNEVKEDAERMKHRKVECNPALANTKTAQAVLKKKASGKTEEQLVVERLKAAKLAKKEKKKRNSLLGKAKKALGM